MKCKICYLYKSKLYNFQAILMIIAKFEVMNNFNEYINKVVDKETVILGDKPIQCIIVKYKN